MYLYTHRICLFHHICKNSFKRLKQTFSWRNILKLSWTWREIHFQSEKPSPKEKITSSKKKALQSAPSKSAKITGFQFHFFNFILTNVFGVNSSRPPARKNTLSFPNTNLYPLDNCAKSVFNVVIVLINFVLILVCGFYLFILIRKNIRFCLIPYLPPSVSVI